ncbi:uncharacterized protein BXZ73DRAFT_101456 [Epithele typhae]|uniref:uncharacterized protein n=1 Tax=Epithele typhae TaxID=378194 RepID=UPI0020084B18|nr:uncharacterized protein BXZ73DRAFT_101456 [Epithele typhae]KAH9932078.1 hypothetical protein BXZ73DRAFT_101456 [Epithele typhae]
MAVLAWAFAWFTTSVLIFLAGRLVPQLRPKSKPAIQLHTVPTRPRSPPRSLSQTPATSLDPKPLPVDPDDAQSCKSVASEAQGSSVSEVSASKRSSPKPRWSFGKSRRTEASPNLALLSDASGSAYPYVGACVANIRLPKVLKNFRRKSSAKARSSPNASPAPTFSSLSALEKPTAEEEVDESLRSRTISLDQPRQVQLAALRSQSEQPVTTSSGETFTSTFVNPFRLKPRRPKTPASAESPAITASEPGPLAFRSPTMPTPRRASGPRRVLNSLSLALTPSNIELVLDIDILRALHFDLCFGIFALSGVPSRSSTDTAIRVPLFCPNAGGHFCRDSLPEQESLT